MSARADAYSRFVAAAKVALPLGALVLLSTLFIFSGEVDPTQSVPYREFDVETILREQRLKSPIYDGVTDAGEAVNLVAARAIPDPNDAERTEFSEMTARLMTGDIETLKVEANLGEVNNGQDIAILTGGTRTTTDDGIIALTETLTASLVKTYAESAGEVTATGPFGNLKAGKMIITRPSKEDDQLIIFQDGVTVLYDNEDE